MPASAYPLLFLGALAGGFVSGLAGFGTALMALGIWLYVLPPSLAVPLVLICSVAGQTSTLPSNVHVAPTAATVVCAAPSRRGHWKLIPS